MSCGWCGAQATAQAKVKRDPIKLEVRRLYEPSDFARPRANDLALDRRGFLPLPEYSGQFPKAAEHELEERGYLPTPQDSDFGNINNFITELITYPGAKPCPLRRSGIGGSSAISVAFDTPPEGTYFPSVSQLEGCTSVVIIGEKGCWISHLWESPAFLATDANFQAWVIDAIEQGTDQCASPFAGGTGTAIPELAVGDSGWKPEIFIMTPFGEDGAGYLFDARIGIVEQALTGAGRAFAGSPVTRRGYTKRPPDAQSAFGKLLIEYTNADENDMGDPLACPQQAHYRVYMETDQMSDHTWVASGNQIQAPAAGAQKRQVASSGGACKAPVSSTQSGSGSATASGSATGTDSSTGTITSSASATDSGSSSGTITSGPTITGSSSTSSTSVSAPVRVLAPLRIYIC